MARSMCDLEVMVVCTPELDLCPLKAVVGVSRWMMAYASQGICTQGLVYYYRAVYQRKGCMVPSQSTVRGRALRH